MRRARPLRLATAVMVALSLLPTPPAHAASSGPPAWIGALPLRALLPGYPQLYQQHRLTCEAASLSMTVRGRPDEAAIVAATPHNANPWLGFRGNIDGVELPANGLRDYGVYAPPLARAARRLGLAVRTFRGSRARYLLEYALGILHRPVVVWLTYGLVRPTRITGRAGGRTFALFWPEHANAVIGYDAGGVTVRDPLRGTLYYPWGAFLAVWDDPDTFDGMALLAAPHLAAPRLRTVGVRRSGTTGVWTWDGVLPGSRVQISVLHGKRRVLTLQLAARTRGARESVRLPLVPGEPVAIRVRAVAPLDVAAPLYAPPALTLPRPTPTTTPTPTATPTTTPSPSPVPTVTPTPTPTATPTLPPSPTTTVAPTATPTLSPTPRPTASATVRLPVVVPTFPPPPTPAPPGGATGG